MASVDGASLILTFREEEPYESESDDDELRDLSKSMECFLLDLESSMVGLDRFPRCPGWCSRNEHKQIKDVFHSSVHQQID